MNRTQLFTATDHAFIYHLFTLRLFLLDLSSVYILLILHSLIDKPFIFIFV